MGKGVASRLDIIIARFGGAADLARVRTAPGYNLLHNVVPSHLHSVRVCAMPVLVAVAVNSG